MFVMSSANPPMLQLDGLSFDSSLILAPLAGYSDLPFRILCRRFGAGFCVSEMINCHGLVYQQKKTLAMLQSTPEEQPVSFQLFGADPDVMVDAAQILASFKPQMLDVNMGCPVKKVTKRGAGAALMAQPKLAEEITRKIVDTVSLPVTVKIRSGVNSAEKNSVEFAKMLEACGVAAVTVHGRTWAQQFTGKADQESIRDVKKALTIPVIGNGDIQSYDQARAMMVNTACDGVMIGRGSLGNPWVFMELGRPNNLSSIAEVATQHLNLIEEYLPTTRIMGYIKNHISRYFRGLPGCSRVRKMVFSAASLEELKELLDSLQLT